MKTSTELATGSLIMNSSIPPGSLPWGITQQGGKGTRNPSYLRESDFRNNDSVHGTGSVAKRLAGVTVRVVLVLVDFAIFLSSVPRHRALADTDVALGVDGGGFAAKVPISPC